MLKLTTTRTKNDKNMLKYRVCIGIFWFTFCYSAIPLAVPFTVENLRRAKKKVCQDFFPCTIPSTWYGPTSYEVTVTGNDTLTLD